MFLFIIRSGVRVYPQPTVTGQKFPKHHAKFRVRGFSDTFDIELYPFHYHVGFSSAGASSFGYWSHTTIGITYKLRSQDRLLEPRLLYILAGPSRLNHKNNQLVLLFSASACMMLHYRVDLCLMPLTSASLAQHPLSMLAHLRQ